MYNNPNDVKELIPEFFYLPEFLVNSNGECLHALALLVNCSYYLVDQKERSFHCDKIFYLCNTIGLLIQ